MRSVLPTLILIAGAGQLGVLVASSLVPLRLFVRGSNLQLGSPTYYSVTLTRGLSVELQRVVAGAETRLAQLNSASYTSGVWVLGNTTGVADESTPVNPLGLVGWRAGVEQQALAAGGAVIRPGCVYGGKQSLFADWFAAAERGQPLRIVGDGENHWSFVNLHDLVDCYLRTVEQRVPGILHAVDDTHATLNACAKAVAPDTATEHVPTDVARASMGAFVDALIVDQHVSSTATRRKLGWSPKRDFVGSVSEQWSEWRAR